MARRKSALALGGVVARRGDRIVLDGISLDVRGGESVAVVGPSGSGKSTLLGVAAGLIPPSQGSVAIEGVHLAGVNERKRARLRLSRVGVVFQFSDLLDELSLRENVELPMRFLAQHSGSAITKRAAQLLEELGLAHVAGQSPVNVSGGERQRAAIARALANEPGLVLADEPTGSLDPANAEAAVKRLRDVVKSRNAGLVLVTHNPAVAIMCDRVLVLRDGRLVSEPDLLSEAR